MTDLLSQLLKDRRWLLSDGATGTNLFDVGLQTGNAPELWNLDTEKQEKVYNLNHAFIAAGADIILDELIRGNASAAEASPGAGSSSCRK